MAKLNVDIVTPERRLLSTPADEVVAPAAEGLYGVRPGHSPFLSTLSPGPLTVREGGTTQAWFVSGGFVEVQNDTVLVLADQAEPAASIDVEAFTGLVNVPFALGLLVAVGLIAMNATIARAFTRGTAVRSC